MTDTGPCGADPLAEVGARLAAVFRVYQETRMAGLACVNPRLSVEVVAPRLVGADWLGILVSPWCMNLVLVPVGDSSRRPGPVGSKQSIPLPAGAVELIAAEDPRLGPFAACSLFSPMDDFPDQGTARATAEAVMAGLFAPAEASLAPGERGGVSRRDLLRGLVRA